MKRIHVGFILFMSLCLSGCFGLSGAWTGASLIYDRHNVYKKMDDFQLVAQARHAIYQDKVFKRDDSTLDLAAFNGDLLLVGHVATDAMRDEAYARVKKLGGYRRLFNQVAVGHPEDSTAEDAWITAKICSQMITDSSLDPGQFKIITSGRVVYLMGDVPIKDAASVIEIARQTSGVLRVVKLLKYYHLSDKADV